MRIAFLTACLEPGNDGVGDYTCDLASECRQRGHPAGLLALHDPHISAPSRSPLRGRYGEIPALRLPSRMAWQERIVLARTWLASLNPDWVSLQFVPYGFHPKGLVWGLGNRLRKLVGGLPLQVTCHELWIGEYLGAPWREKLVGWLQRHGVRRLLASLHPCLLHTTNPTYVAILEHYGLAARHLPLCGSIPIDASADRKWLYALARQHGVNLYSESRDRFWLFGFFGALHPLWTPEPLFQLIAEAARVQKKEVVMAAIGRLSYGEKLWGKIAKTYGERFHFLTCGPRSRSEISAFLHEIDFAIATSPYWLIGKSATAAAMLEHGVPTIVSRDDVQFRYAIAPPDEPLLYKLDDRLPEWLGQARRAPAHPRLGDLCDRFLADLERASN